MNHFLILILENINKQVKKREKCVFNFYCALRLPDPCKQLLSITDFSSTLNRRENDVKAEREKLFSEEKGEEKGGQSSSSSFSLIINSLSPVTRFPSSNINSN